MNATEKKAQTWYRANKMSSRGEIECISVIGFTDKFVSYVHATSPGMVAREAKTTAWGQWFDNKADAVAFQRKRLAENVERLRTAAVNAERHLDDFSAAYPEF